MNIKAALSKFLKSADLNGQTITVVIRDVIIEKVSPTETKPVLYSTGLSDKGIVVNMTKADVLEYAYGAESDAYVGLPLNLSPGKTFYQGKTVDCIDFSIPAQAPTADPPPPDDVL